MSSLRISYLLPREVSLRGVRISRTVKVDPKLYRLEDDTQPVHAYELLLALSFLSQIRGEVNTVSASWNRLAYHHHVINMSEEEGAQAESERATHNKEPYNIIYRRKPVVSAAREGVGLVVDTAQL